MAQSVVVGGLGPDEEHGQAKLDEVAEHLRQATPDHLEGRDDGAEARCLNRGQARSV